MKIKESPSLRAAKRRGNLVFLKNTRLPRKILYILLAMTYLIITPTYASEKTLNLYIWGEYITNNMLKQFTDETGIKVNLSTYDNNETMFAKLKSLKNPNYDIVLPSGYYIERMAKQGMLEKIDKNKLSNLKNIHPFFLNKAFDPNNKYSIPYWWGSTGIVKNKMYIKNKITSWQDLWSKEYKNKLLLFNDIRDVFSMALLVLGYSVNDTDPKHIEEAYLKLEKLMSNVKILSIEAIPNIYIDEDIVVGMIWSGDYSLAYQENPSLEYIHPKEGFSIWIDSFAIVKNAPHIENAHKFIDFILRPEISQKATLAFGYPTANKEASKLMPKEWQKNPINNPEIIKRGEILRDLDNETRLLYEKYWERLKLGN